MQAVLKFLWNMLSANDFAVEKTIAALLGL
jgi:hypothetical protein